jgi:hypothetical protein
MDDSGQAWGEIPRCGVALVATLGGTMFEEFWKHYPRKVSKKIAQQEWNRLTPMEQTKCLEVIHTHIKYWQATNTEPQFIPHARTWIHQGRFDDELEMPQAKIKTDVAWWGSEPLILAKGREVNLEPRPGESIHEFKGRVVDKLRSAA